MKLVCEVIANQVLPTLRALIAKDLMERHNMNQQEAAECLGITQPAISQYRRALRGYKAKVFTKDRNVYLKVTEIGNALARGDMGKEQLASTFCEVCKLLRKKGLVCKLHKKDFPVEECNICK